MRKKIAIIGGGCSGLLLANLLSNSNFDIVIFEKNNKLGKKILASGNGKCNFSNVNIYDEKYNDVFANNIINEFDVKETLGAFSKMGLIFKNDIEGRCYPVSECATSVLDCLKKGLKDINVLLECEVTHIVKKDTKYIVKYNNKEDTFDYVICCSGSSASNLGSEKAYNYLKSLNVQFTDICSSLVPVFVKENISMLQGSRVKCLVKLVNNGKLIYSEKGEVMFKKDALSGIAVFNASSYINRNIREKYTIELDLSSGMNKEELRKYFKREKTNIYNLFKGFLNDKLAEYIINKNELCDLSINDFVIDKLLNDVFNLRFNVIGLYPIKEGQVCSGGVSLCEITKNLEFLKYPNVYVAGELIDIDGVCGGYNMQFAWSCAGVIANQIKLKEKLL